jgi:hypothetical protein
VQYRFPTFLASPYPILPAVNGFSAHKLFNIFLNKYLQPTLSEQALKLHVLSFSLPGIIYNASWDEVRMSGSAGLML